MASSAIIELYAAETPLFHAATNFSTVARTVAASGEVLSML